MLVLLLAVASAVGFYGTLHGNTVLQQVALVLAVIVMFGVVVGRHRGP